MIFVIKKTRRKNLLELFFRLMCVCVCCFFGDDFCCLGGNVAIVLNNSIFKCNIHNIYNLCLFQVKNILNIQYSHINAISFSHGGGWDGFGLFGLSLALIPLGYLFP